MKAAVIVFPGSNCDRDMASALHKYASADVKMVWHGEASLPRVDFIAIPGGFSYGDYLRPGAIASKSPVMNAVIKHASEGVPVLGICNGFQVLTECGLLPGTLLRNRNLKFICQITTLKVSTSNSLFTSTFEKNSLVSMPIAHNDGSYFADHNTLDRLTAENRIAFRYCLTDGSVDYDKSPNGSQMSIAGILSESRRVLGMMPHPERATDIEHGSTDGKFMFDALIDELS
jgi:phosphoribosylformylglycinamidine synthase I